MANLLSILKGTVLPSFYTMCGDSGGEGAGSGGNGDMGNGTDAGDQGSTADASGAGQGPESGGDDSGGSEGGFGGLGIGNPGSYGGASSVGAPGFGGTSSDLGGTDLGDQGFAPGPDVTDQFSGYDQDYGFETKAQAQQALADANVAPGTQTSFGYTAGYSAPNFMDAFETGATVGMSALGVPGALVGGMLGVAYAGATAKAGMVTAGGTTTTNDDTNDGSGGGSEGNSGLTTAQKVASTTPSTTTPVTASPVDANPFDGTSWWDNKIRQDAANRVGLRQMRQMDPRYAGMMNLYTPRAE